MNDEKYMKMAIEIAREGMNAGQSPFGAVIVKGDQVVASTHNRVWANTDPTAHAEVQAIRAACENLGTIDLSGCVIYSTTEPCPMCFAAIHWAKIDKVVFGARIADAAGAGFNELYISNEQMKSIGQSPVEIVAGVMQAECAALFDEWVNSPTARRY